MANPTDQSCYWYDHRQYDRPELRCRPPCKDSCKHRIVDEAKVQRAVDALCREMNPPRPKLRRRRRWWWF